MKLGRRRGQLRTGCVFIQRNRWYGKYSRKISGKVRQSAMPLGRIETMTEAEAREKLRKVIEQDDHVRSVCEIISQSEIILPLPWEMPKTEFLDDRHSRGAVAVMRVATDLLSRGFHPYQPFSPAAPFDIFALVHGWKAVRIEVKMAKIEPSGTIYCNVSRNVGKFDVLAAVTPDGLVHYIASSLIKDLQRPFGKKSQSVPLSSSSGVLSVG